MADSENDAKEIAHFTFFWTIENMREELYLFSPEFKLQSTGEMNWNLFICCSKYSEFIFLCIQKTFSLDKVDEPDSIEISLLGIDGQPLIKMKNTKQFETGDIYKFGNLINYDEVFAQKKAEFLPRGTLTVRCRMWRTETEVSTQEICYARTLLREFRGSCVAEIKDFSSLRGGEEREALLHAPAGEVIPLTLKCFLREDNYVCFDIQHNNTEELWQGDIKICLLDSKGKEHLEVSDDLYHSHSSILSFENFAEKRWLIADKECFLPDDVLSLRVEYKVVAENSKIIEKCPKSLEMAESCASEIDKKDLGEQKETSCVPSSTIDALKILLEEGVLSDVSLQSGSKSFPAHKCILSVRSPVFKAMFSGDTKKTSKSVVVPDLVEDTLRELLSYIYTDEVGELEWRGASDLYRAACKYALPDLTRKCATLLKSDLSVGNVCAVLGVADLNQDRELREAALEFAVMEGEKFLSSDEWRSLKEENSKLAVEIMERIFCNMKTNL